MNSPTLEKTKEGRNIILHSLSKKKLPNSLYQSAGLLRRKATTIHAELIKIKKDWKTRT